MYRFRFTLYLRAIFQVQAPGGFYLEGRFNGGKHDGNHMFPSSDTLRLPVFPSLRFRRNRTSFSYVSVKFPSKETGVSTSVNAWHPCGNTRKRSGSKSISCFRQRNRT